MDVAIIGAGAVGLLTAAHIAKVGGNVTVYTRRKEQAETINELGILLIQGQAEETIKVNAKPLKGRISERLIILTVKQYHLESVISMLGEIEKTQSILFLQNGMGHVKLLSKLIDDITILLGVVEHGALKRDDRSVEHTGIGKIQLSIYRGDHSSLDCLQQLGTSNFPFEHRKDWREMLSNKLAANAVINSLTALYRVQNGALIEEPEFYEMMEQVFNEVDDVLQLSKREDTWENILTICERTAGNTSSMLKDFQMGRKTELEAILGYLIHTANDKNVNVPILTFLFKSLKGLEGRFISC
ncbi:2-dehydropantoate 2-reductase [Bacillus solimangrovi]|uniref:2-dehydropantoate 2-reductase n=1 Tax=Bacillus solimangrovi TaxID=1305675 RepID=A0A1E5LIN4_9BACI|nr:2-dehydropantoate 2-reductase [Bacillus solimangrovi]OEH93940.1 hypothetical protein BFG57_10770 [Bacillus solimangrovi]